MALYRLEIPKSLKLSNKLPSVHKRNLFPICSTKIGPSLMFLSFTRRNGLHLVASNKNGGITETSEGEILQRSYTWRDKKKPRICILGGGFGGLYTALRLESLVWPDNKKPEVLLVDQSERFVFKPLLYELLSGEVDSWEIAPRFTELLSSTSVQFYQDRVKFIHPYDHLGMNDEDIGGVVHLKSGLLIQYDWLVLALGANSKLDVVPGAMEFALPFSTLEDACKVDEKLKSLERKYFGKDTQVRVAVVGCGYAGVELAATVSERLQNKGIVQAINVGKTILPNAPPGNREAALKVLSSRNVQIMLGYFVRCVKKDDEQVNCEKLILELEPIEKGQERKIVKADIVVWTVGSKALLPEMRACDKTKHELPMNGRGQAETEDTLRVKGHPRIFAIGDSSSFRDSKGKFLPPTAQVAFQQADFAGWNIWAAINSKPLLPFRFQNLGEMMALGRKDAAITPSFIDGLTLEGRIGHTARKIAYLLRLPTDEHKLKVGVSWLTKSAIESAAVVQETLTKAISGSL